jgi:enoyl-CoA hydratase/carnithine racemase
VKTHAGERLSWTVRSSVVEVELHGPPANEIGSRTLEELEAFADALPDLEERARAVILHSTVKAGFSAGADLRELYERSRALAPAERTARVREFLTRVHRVFDRLDSSPLTTIAAVHGVVFGGGLELALTCDLIVADRMSRFCFPELRLGLIPGFGGIPRLARDVGNAVVRDLLLTGRSVGAARAHEIGLVSQLAGEGNALAVARSTAAQVAKLDGDTAARAKRFLKPIPGEEMAREIDTFLELFASPRVETALRRFVESGDPMPYLPSERAGSERA